MPKTINLQTLAAQEQVAREAYEQAQAAAEKARHASDQRRAAALADYDRTVIEKYDAADLQRDIDAARARVADAIAADPVMQALGDLYVAQLVAYHRHQEVTNAATRIGEDASTFGPATIAPPPELATIIKIVERSAIDTVGDIVDGIEQARIAAGDARA